MSLTSTYWKHIPTIKLAVQLVKPATAIAEGRGPWENNSATMNHGMGPGPISKNATKAKMATMLRYDIHLSWSCQSRRARLVTVILNLLVNATKRSTSRAVAIVIKTADPAIPSSPVKCRDLRPARSTTNSYIGKENKKRIVNQNKHFNSAILQTVDFTPNYNCVLMSLGLNIKKFGCILTVVG